MKKLFTLFALLFLFTSITYSQVDVSGAVGGNGSYSTLAAAFTAINGTVQTGANITILISGNTTETATATLNSGAWSSLTITPTGGSRVISGSITTSVVRLNGADNVTIDGRISGSGRNLTIQNTSTATGTAAIWLSSVAVGNGASNNTIRNLEILCGTNLVTSANATYGIIMCGTSILTTSNGEDNDNNTFTENRIIKCRYGIVTRGNTTNNNQNIIVSNNIIGPTSFGTDEIGKVGIFMQADNNAQVINNTIQYVGGTFTTTSAGADRVGIGIGQESWSNTTTSTITSGNYTVTGNNINNVVEERLFSSVGILVGTTLGGPKTNNIIANNFIYNVRSNGTGGDQGIGIGHCGGPGDKIVFNSILMTGDVDPTGTTSGSTNPLNIGISKHIASAPDTALTIKNNIVSMDMNSNTTTLLFLCIQTPTSPYSWGSGGVNNNVYYFPTGNTQMRTGGTGTSSTPVYLTLANWQTAYSPAQDAASLDINPPFISLTDLHINPLISTQIESGGTPITGVITDIDGNTRNISTPDIGADEGSFTPPAGMTYVSSTATQNNTNIIALNSVNQEIIGIQIVTSGTFSPLNLTSLNLNTNGSSDPSGDISNAKVWYTGTSSTFAATTQFGSTFSGPAGAFSVSGSQTMAQGTNYFWVTYDITGSGTPGNLVDAEVNSVTGSGSMGTQTPTVQAPSGSRQITGPLSGIYTIGVSAFNKLSGKNLEQVRLTRKVKKLVPVESFRKVSKDEKRSSATEISFKVSENEIEYREEEVVEEYYEIHENGRKYEGDLYAKNNGNIPGVRGVGDYATITAALNDLNSRGVSGPVEFHLLDATYGSESYPLQFNNGIPGVSASNNVTLKPAPGVSSTISGSINSNAVIRVLSNYVTIDGSNSNGTDRSLSILNNSTTSPNVILVGSTGTTAITNVTIENCSITNGANTSSGIVVSDAGTIGNAGYFNTITIQNNNIQRAFIGVYSIGGTTPQNGQNLFYYNNSLNTSGANSIRLCGLYMQGVNSGIVSGNTIANFSGTDGEADKGMWLATGCINVTVERNTIHSLNYTGTGGYGGQGIVLSPGVANANLVVKNNMIYNLSGDGWSYTAIPTDNTIGISVLNTTQSGFNIYNNSIFLSGNTLNQTSALSMGVYIGAGSTSVDLRNNIIVNNLGLLSATGQGAASVYVQTANTQLSQSNYNCYFTNPTGSGTKEIGRIAATGQTTMAGWRTATTRDQISFNVLPIFTSNTNLHIQASDLSVKGRGTYISGVNNDYDGDSRPTAQSTTVSPVDVGCDQYSPSGYSGNLTVNSGAFYYDGNLRAVEVISGTVSATIRQFTGVQTPNNTLRPGTINPKDNLINKDSKLKPQIQDQFKGRNGKSGGETNRAAVTTPWIYWQILNLNTSFAAATMRFYYNDEQLATINESSLQISYWDGSTWDNSFTQTVNTTANYIELTLPDGLAWPTDILFAMEDDNTPLPVVLTDFNVHALNRDANLSWGTAAELNNKGFAIERRSMLSSQSGSFSSWQEIAFVSGKGTTNQAQSYTYTDKKLNKGIYQYRLRQVDYNGNFEYFSPSQSDVSIGSPINFDISQNYPNPSNPVSKIDFQMPFDGQVSLKVFDITGKEVKSLIDGYRTADFYTVEFNGSDLASGVYFYRIVAEGNNDKFTKTLKMILVK